ncbi:MAG TPA: M35 family metallo-endopeptidase [Niastella sp.]
MRKPAARIEDKHTCPAATPVPHVGGPIIGPCCTSVLIEEMPAARVGDFCDCNGVPDAILTGSSGVFIGGKPAARIGDKTVHGGVIKTGCASVLIGEIGGYTGEDGTLAGFIIPSEEEKVRIINETIQACIMLLTNKLNLLKKDDPKTLEEFVEWFGVRDEGAREIIINRIDRELDFFEYITDHDFDMIQDDEIRVKSYAEVYPYDELHTIFWGDKFWSAGGKDDDSKENVLIHEVSHFEYIGNTFDFDYGIEQCQKMAKNNPGKALFNADTFAFFIEA